MKRLPLLLLTATILAGCGEEKVVSKYKEVPKPIDFAIELPDLEATRGVLKDAAPVALPRNKRFSLQGEISGVAGLKKNAFAALATIHPRGNPDMTCASGFLTTEFPTNDIVKYSVVMEPMARGGDMEIWIHLRTFEPFVLPARMQD